MEGDTFLNDVQETFRPIAPPRARAEVGRPLATSTPGQGPRLHIPEATLISGISGQGTHPRAQPVGPQFLPVDLPDTNLQLAVTESGIMQGRWYHM